MQGYIFVVFTLQVETMLFKDVLERRGTVLQIFQGPGERTRLQRLLQLQNHESEPREM